MTQDLGNKKPTKNNKYFQAPNLPIIIWFVSLMLTKVTEGPFQSFFSIVSFGALFTWSWLEIFYGTNTFRRILGVTVLILAIANRI